MRTPPQDLDAEAAVLSAVLLSRDAFDQVADTLKAEHFYAEAHRRIFEAACDLIANGKPADLRTVASWLRDRGRLDQIGGAAYLGQISDAVPAVANVSAYAQIVRDKARIRSVVTVCQRIAADGYGQIEDAQSFVDKAEQSLYEIAHEQAPTTMVALGEAARIAFRTIGEAATRGKAITGLPTGLERLDSLTAGLHPGELTIVAARPGMGKSSLAMDLALNVASASEEPASVAFFSLEMPKEQLAMRAACAWGRVDVSKLRQHHRLTERDWADITRAMADITKLPIAIDDTAGLSLLELRAKTRRAAADFARENKPPLGLVVIDYLQLMRGDPSAKSREQEVAGVSRGLKQLAKELGVPVIALAQLNRNVEARGKNDKRPQLSDLRESGAIEQDADNVLFIHRDDYYDREAETKGIAELIVAKQRNGATGIAKVKWLAHCTSFRDLEPHEMSNEESHQ